MANPAKFIREVRKETGRVVWPTRKETTVSTIMVLVFVLISSIFFLLVDNLSQWAIQFILGFGA